ncbi:MAG: response regulator [Nitrospirae bacterium]|nr:response regulator [Nitrospirota bacterium]
MSILNATAAPILLVEDDPGHALLIKKNLQRGGVTHEIVVLDDGRKAVNYLFKQGEYATDERPAPDLILLDLNLPILSGYQVLKIIKNDERTKKVPVVVLTTTDNPQEVERCYDLGCNMYITKPVEYDKFSDTIQKLSRFISIVKTPNKE